MNLTQDENVRTGTLEELVVYHVPHVAFSVNPYGVLANM